MLFVSALRRRPHHFQCFACGFSGGRGLVWSEQCLVVTIFFVTNFLTNTRVILCPPYMLPSSHTVVGVHFEAVFVRRQARQDLNGRRCSGRLRLCNVRQPKHVIVRCLASAYFGFLPILLPAAQFAETCQRHHQSSLLEALR